MAQIQFYKASNILYWAFTIQFYQETQLNLIPVSGAVALSMACALVENWSGSRNFPPIPRNSKTRTHVSRFTDVSKQLKSTDTILCV